MSATDINRRGAEAQRKQAARIEELEAEIKRLRALGRTKRQPLNTLGGTIQLLREAQNLSLSDLASRSDISKGSLSRIESKANCDVRFSSLERLSTGLGFTVAQVLTAHQERFAGGEVGQ